MNTAVKLNNLPPMLQQYVDYKKEYPDCLLLFQVGDFYELFFEDAVTVSRTLNLTLTSRDKNSPEPVPMCGVPIAVVDAYAERLVEAGFSVAIVSQNEAVASEKGTSGKGMVGRSLERIITPGIKILGNAGKDSSEKIVAAVFPESDQEIAIAFADVQTSVLYVRDNQNVRSLPQELQRIGPVEIILPSVAGAQKLDRRISWVAGLEQQVRNTSLKFRSESLSRNSQQRREYAGIKGYSALSECAKKAVRLLLSYIDETTVNLSLPISEISQKSYEGILAVDATTRANLELVKNLRSNTEEGTLFACLNRTCSVGGARLLRSWILNPLTDAGSITARQSAVTALLSDSILRGDIRQALGFVADIERIATRLELQAVLPRELAALRDTLDKVPLIAGDLAKLLELSGGAAKQPLLQGILSGLEAPEGLGKLLSESLIDNPEMSLNQGGIIREGYNPELDRLRGIKLNGKSWIAELETREKQRTGIGSLKIKYNNVIGYFIEVTSANAGKVPADYTRRQSTANTERFTTDELRLREKEVLGAEGKQIALEREIYERIRRECAQYVVPIRKISAALGSLDVLAGLAELAEKEDLVLPEINESCGLYIKNGKHPVLAAALGRDFVPTSLDMKEDTESFFLITGPNMGGKSTYLRQAALIVIMAQIGSYVPAAAARIGVVDRIFARLGASDNQHEGESTFMVEMREASYILASAARRSLVLIDEIGRGTATADGLAIARAILEWITCKIRCRTLFATHFHELTGLEQRLPGVVNYSVGSFEKEGQVVFTHQICRGPASRSYGIEVAKLAGLPAELLKRSRELLLEGASSAPPPSGQAQLSMFEKSPVDEALQEELKTCQAIVDRIRSININTTTPLEALSVLNQLISEASVK